MKKKETRGCAISENTQNKFFIVDFISYFYYTTNNLKLWQL